MRSNDNLDIFSKTISEYLKERGAELKSDDAWIKKILNNSSEVKTDILESAPNLKEINNKVKDLAEIILRTRSDVEDSVSKYKQLYEDTTILYNKTIELESDLKNTIKKVKIIDWILIWCGIIFVVTFVGRLIDDYNFRWTKTEQLNQEISRIEQKIVEYDSRLDLFTEFFNKNSELNENYINSKIEAEVNKAVLEFYKSQ